MTWVEVLILGSTAGAIGGFSQRRKRVAQFVMLLSLFVLGSLLAMFGREFITELW